MGNHQKISDILVFRGVPSLYSYRVPDSLSLAPGDIVNIPFGKSLTEGMVMTLKDPELETLKLKDIAEKTDKYSSVPDSLVALIHWFQTHYQTTPYKAFQTVVGKVKSREVELPSTESVNKEIKGHELTEDQSKCLNAILDQEKGSFLLHGVTGSGKTEIYLQLAAHFLKQNKQSIIMVPEIALTPQFQQIFFDRFGEGMVEIVHSGLTPKKRELAWQRIRLGISPIVIGPRSAVFTPCQNLGMIAIDEEHEPSYKQDTHPRYDTIEIARHRAQQSGCLLLLGSATPRIESYYQTQGKSPSLKYLSLPHRVGGQPMPAVELVNMKDEKDGGNLHLLSSKLRTLLEDRFEKKEKSIILLNRRGYATTIQCSACGTVHTCPQCQLSYTYHKDRYFRCHRCFIQKPQTHYCAKCKKNRLQFMGLGIQKVEAELKMTFPKASILRLDKDTAKTATALTEILEEFKSTGDILIGTQMVAKGHHIEAVTLVGVLGIDTTLNLPDFRSPERVFQLVTQVAGRSGRGKVTGEVVVQTYQPEHYATQFAKQQDFKQFYDEEVSFREMLNYPPFSRLVHIIISSKYAREALQFSKHLGTYLKKEIEDPEIDILGPEPAPIEKIRDHFRYHFLIKSSDSSLEKLKICIASRPEPKRSVRVIVDYDPRSIL